MTKSEPAHLLGVRIDAVTWHDIERFCRDALGNHNSKQIVTVNGEFILEAQHNLPFREVINNADLVIPDSTNVVWLSKLKDKPLPAVTPGSELVVRLARIAAEKKKSVFLLGAREGIAQRAANSLQQQIPSLTVAGTSCADPDDSAAVRLINQSKADIVLVAYGAPKQDLWIAENKEASGAKILVGVGGTFDMLAGVLPRAPKFM